MKRERPAVEDVVQWVTVDDVAKLRGADLTGLDLSDQELWGANFNGQNLRGCRFVNGNLYGVDMRDADLRDCDFSHANLERADLRGARVNDATKFPETFDVSRFGLVSDDEES